MTIAHEMAFRFIKDMIEMKYKHVTLCELRTWSCHTRMNAEISRCKIQLFPTDVFNSRGSIYWPRGSKVFLFSWKTSIKTGWWFQPL